MCAHIRTLEIKWHTSALFYADDVNIWAELYIVERKNTETLELSSTENGLEVNADKTKYTVMS
jgi:hypothetical protein